MLTDDLKLIFKPEFSSFWTFFFPQFSSAYVAPTICFKEEALAWSFVSKWE